MCQKKTEGRKAEKQLNNETAATQLEDSIIRFSKSKKQGFLSGFQNLPLGGDSLAQASSQKQLSVL